MKIVTVVGARPQFIKAAAVSRPLRQECQEILVHTGQHYDSNMSDVFFEELNIPYPDINLGVGSGTHAVQTAKMLMRLEEVFLNERPDYVLVYGDTNSTLAGALAASKLFIPVIHVEAGLRSFDKRMPEEQNRILTDHLSSLLFCPTDVSLQYLKREGIECGVHKVGDVMCDAVLHYSENLQANSKDYYINRLEGIFTSGVTFSNWYLATIHRAENTDKAEIIEKILSALEELPNTTIFPVHPRISEHIKTLNEKNDYKQIYFVKPLGYLDMLYFVKNSIKIITDSGGLQKEAYIMGTPCVTVRDQTEWTETLIGNHNILAKPDREDILDKIMNSKIELNSKHNYYGDGHAAEKIIKIIKEGKR